MKQKPRWLTQERLDQIGLFVILLLCFTYFFPHWADPNQNSRLDMVVAVVEDGTFQIDKYVHNTVDYAKVGEHYYSDKAPGTAFLGIPLYAGLKVFLEMPLMNGLMTRLSNNEAFKATLRENGSGILLQKVRFALAQVALTLVAAALPSALLGVLIYRFSTRFRTGRRAQIGLVLGYGLLTPAFAYAWAFYGHQLSAMLLFGAFWLAFQIGEMANERDAGGQSSLPADQTPRLALRLLAIGLLLGYSVITEYPSVLVAGILGLYTLYNLYRLGRWQQIGWVIPPAALVAVGWMVYNTAIFGGPLKLGYGESTLWQTQHQTGFMSLTLPHGEALWGITFGVFRGLFFLSPWLLLCMPGFWLWWRTREYRPEFWVALTSGLAFLLFNASSIMWWGGFAVGPRYMLPALPFMVLPVAFALRQWGSQPWLRALLALLFGWSLIATWGLTLAEQAFPPDTVPNPLLEYAWPNWQAGNIARNVGTVVGFLHWWSLVPLVVAATLVVTAWWALNCRLQLLGATSPGLGSHLAKRVFSRTTGEQP
jgi:hypothetical protein